MTDPADTLRLGPGVTIPMSELQWRFSAAGGPGGQHANTANTRVEVVFDIAGSPSLPESVRRRLIAKLGPTARAGSADQRSQWQNRRVATERLRVQLAAALVVPRRRVATRPTLGSQTRRLDAKRRAAQRKLGRRRPDAGE